MTAQVTITRLVASDPDRSPHYYLFQEPDYREQDQARLDAWERGAWEFVGVQARAEIRVPYGKDFITCSITSPGIWGIESDSGEEYFNEVFAEERATLIEMLESLRDYVITGD